MRDHYFHRVNRLSPTKFWINNPSRADAAWALAEGALGCTNNPSYSFKMLADPEDGDRARTLLAEAVAESPDDDEAAAILQRKLVKGIQELFFPLWEGSGGRDGYVSIQGDPVHEHDPEVILREARENRALGPNIAVKIPCTKAGLQAMESLVAEGFPINATEIMSVSQGMALCELYERVSRASGARPPLWLSFIAGIYDEHLENFVRDEGIEIEDDVLRQAGLAAARKMYDIMRDRGYSAVMIGGGARQLRHFTEMVGADLVVTINRRGTADLLIEQDPDVVHRFGNPVPPLVIDELLEKLPDFRRGWYPDGLAVDEYEDFGPVALFRSMFLASWRGVLDRIAQARKAGPAP